MPMVRILGGAGVAGLLSPTARGAPPAGAHPAIKASARQLTKQTDAFLRGTLRAVLSSRFPARHVVFQVKELHRVPAHHAVLLLFRDAGEDAVDQLAGLWPVGLLVWEVARPDHSVQPDVVPHLDPDSVALEAPVAVLADILAGQALETLHAQQVLCPVPMSFVALVGLLHEERNPANLVLCEID